jgi:sulfate permease, SulP family
VNGRLAASAVGADKARERFARRDHHLPAHLGAAPPDDESIPGVLIVRVEERMTFASAPRAGEQLRALVQDAQPRVLVLDCSAIPDIEYTAPRMMENLERNLRASGVTLCLAGLNPEPLRLIDRSALGRTLGRERMFFSIEHAVDAHRGGARAPASE